MSKSIYEEVLKSLNKYYDKKSVEYLDQQDNLIKQDYGDWWLLDYSDYHKIKKALEQAQKQEKLLELYKELEHIRLESYVKYEPNEVIRLVKLARKIKQQIKEIENENIRCF